MITLPDVIARVNELSANAGLPPLGDAATPVLEPAFVPDADAEEAQRAENQKQAAKQEPVPFTWQVGHLAQRKGVLARDPQPIIEINYQSGIVLVDTWDDSDGWKRMGVTWEQLHNVSLDGPQG